MPTFKVETSDDEVVEIPASVVVCVDEFKERVSDGTYTVSYPITSATLENILTWFENPSNIKIDTMEDLIDLLWAARWLDLDFLRCYVCYKIGSKATHCTPEQFRAELHIENGFSDTERRKILRYIDLMEHFVP